MSRWFTGILISLVVCGSAGAQTADTTRPCSAPEASQFDFWLGEWNLTWADSGRGTNTITKPLGDCVVLEQFADADPKGLRGMSTSVYNPRLKRWQQTWVDNYGSYLDFEGGIVDGRMILAREGVNREGKPVRQRMVFRDITADRFVWDWQSSEDGGKTWKTNWQINYSRKK